MKFKILESQSSDAGTYTGMVGVIYGSTVEAEYCNDKKNAIFVSGKEFINIGADVKKFKPEWKYMWGNFEEVL